MSPSRKIRTMYLADTDPHPQNGSPIVGYWWGNIITIGEAEIPQRQHPCGTRYIYPILGPTELVELINRHGLGPYVCEHQIRDPNA